MLRFGRNRDGGSVSGMALSVGALFYQQLFGLPSLNISHLSKSKVLSTHLKTKTLSHFLDPDTAVADNFVLPSPMGTTTVIGCWFLYSTSRCLNRIAGSLFVAGGNARIAEEEGDWSHSAKVQEGSELEVGSDGRSLLEDTENYCSLVRTLDSSLMARPFRLVVSKLWVALAETEQMKAVDGKGVQVVPAVGSVLVGMGHTDSAGIDEENLLNVADTLNWMLEIDMQDTPSVEIRKAKSWKTSLCAHG